MNGPKLQQPQALGPMVEPDTSLPTFAYANFFNSIQLIAFYSTRSGTTAERPTASTMARWIGMPYMDMTLGKPVFLKIASSNTWVDGSGAVV